MYSYFGHTNSLSKTFIFIIRNSFCHSFDTKLSHFQMGPRKLEDKEIEGYNAEPPKVKAKVRIILALNP